MSPAFPDEASSESSSRPSYPANLLSLPVELRLGIYAYLFGTRIATIAGSPFWKRDGEQINIQNPELRMTLDKKNDRISRTERSSQILPVCRKIWQEALPVLYANTTFYLHGFAHLASLSRLVDCNSIQKIVLRLEVRETRDWLEMASALNTLDLDGVVLPKLTWLGIKVKAVKVNFNTVFGARFIRADVLSEILRIKDFHPQLKLLFEAETRNGDELAYRLATVNAVCQKDVSYQTRKPTLSVANLLKENLVDVKAILPEVVQHLLRLRMRYSGGKKDSHN